MYSLSTNLESIAAESPFDPPKSSGLMELEEEQQLIEDAKNDTESFGRIYDRYFPKIYAFIAYKVNSRDDAEDLASEVFMKALEHLPGYEWRGVPFAAWLFTIARNTLNNYYAKNAKSRHSDLEEAHYVVEDDEQISPSKQAHKNELSEKVSAILAELPERELTVVQLKFFSQLNNREIMHITGLSESNVAVILYRTLRKIKPDLEYFA